MYIPPLNLEQRTEVLHDYIDAHPFATLVTATPEGPFATHLPVMLDRAAGAHGILHAHIARANPHHKRPVLGEALVIFQGPDAYITPNWYASKAEHGKAVPTWNYISVHAYGTPRWVEDPEFLRAHLETLTSRIEGPRQPSWSQADAPADFIAQMQKGIVGVEIPIARLEGKWKMSQNRPPADIDGVVRGLAASPSERDREVGRIVAAVRPKPKE